MVPYGTTVGKGSYGTVVLKKILHLDTIVAAKIVSDTKLKVEREVQIMTILSGHTNFPYLYGFVYPGTILMNFLGSIADGNSTRYPSLRQFASSSSHQVAKISLSLAQALKYMHSSKILHNDLHMSNIIIKVDDIPVIIDFGKATHVTKGKVYNIVGTPHQAIYKKQHIYLAHELRYTNGIATNPSTDVYSLGFCLHFLASAASDGTNVNNLTVHEVSKRMMHTDPEKRYSIEDVIIKLSANLK